MSNYMDPKRYKNEDKILSISININWGGTLTY